MNLFSPANQNPGVPDLETLTIIREYRDIAILLSFLQERALRFHLRRKFLKSIIPRNYDTIRVIEIIVF